MSAGTVRSAASLVAVALAAGLAGAVVVAGRAHRASPGAPAPALRPPRPFVAVAYDRARIPPGATAPLSTTEHVDLRDVAGAVAEYDLGGATLFAIAPAAGATSTRSFYVSRPPGAAPALLRDGELVVVDGETYALVRDADDVETLVEPGGPAEPLHALATAPFGSKFRIVARTRDGLVALLVPTYGHPVPTAAWTIHGPGSVSVRAVDTRGGFVAGPWYAGRVPVVYGEVPSAPTPASSRGLELVDLDLATGARWPVGPYVVGFTQGTAAPHPVLPRVTRGADGAVLVEPPNVR